MTNTSTSAKARVMSASGTMLNTATNTATNALDNIVAEVGLQRAEDITDVTSAVKAGLSKFILHYSYLLKDDDETVKERNRDYAAVLSDQEPTVIVLAMLEWLARPNDFAPRPGQWRDYCERIQHEIDERGDCSRFIKGVWESVQVRRAEQREWAKHMTAHTRRYIALKRTERQATDQKQAEARAGARAVRVLEAARCRSAH